MADPCSSRPADRRILDPSKHTPCRAVRRNREIQHAEENQMRRIQRVISLFIVALLTMGLGCDTGNSGNGGTSTTPTAKTYSISDLTGNWTLVEAGTGVPARVGVLGFNNRGQISLWQFPPGPPIGSPNSGQISVSPDGKITGAVTMMGDVLKFDLQFQAGGSISGRMFYIPGGATQVYSWKLTRT